MGLITFDLTISLVPNGDKSLHLTNDDCLTDTYDAFPGWQK